MRHIHLLVEAPADRLDRYVSDCLPDFSRSRIQQLIIQECVSVNDRICTSKKASLQAGDRLAITIPDPKPLDLEPSEIPIEILFEDDHLAIVNKPAGLVVHPAPGHAQDTLVNALLSRCSLASIGGIQRPGIVHRLDKDTTGVMVVAKTDLALQHLQAQLKAKTARREYLGVVYGAPSQERGTVDAPIGRHPVDRKRMAVLPTERGGRTAITHWQIRERLGNYSLLHFQLETGRTHQIRVHSTHIGHPIVGDPVYCRSKFVGVNLPGQALHAWKLRLIHPVSGEALETIAPLPERLETLLRYLRDRA